MKKLLPLIFLITVGIGLGMVYAQTTYERGTVFISEVGGGNITFAQNITATTFSNAVGNQARFTVLDMLGNGTWSRLGFGSDNNNNTMNITSLGAGYIQFDAIIENNTVLEIYLPDATPPDTVTGGIANNWIAPTLFVTMTGDDTVVLEWGVAANQGNLYDSLGSLIFILPILALLFFFSDNIYDLQRNPVFILLIAISIFGAIIWIAVNTGWV